MWSLEVVNLQLRIKLNKRSLRATVTIPHVDCRYVLLFYFMFHHFLPTLPAIPMHDPRGWHVIQHHMTDSLGHLPVARVDTCHLACELLYHHHYTYIWTLQLCQHVPAVLYALELDHRWYVIIHGSSSNSCLAVQSSLGDYCTFIYLLMILAKLGTSTVNRIGTVDQNCEFARCLFICGSVQMVTVHLW